MANGQIRYTVDFDVNQQKLKELKAQLQEIQKLTITDVMKNSGLNHSQATKALNNIKAEAANVEIALKKAFNPKLNSINIQEFNNQLIKNGSSVQRVQQAFLKMGAAGHSAFNKMSSQVLGVNVRMRESNTLLDKMATTLGNSIKWNIASSAINGVSRGIQQAWGFTKSLDSSLNDIRIVTGKTADEMARFSVQANQAAQNLGKNTTDYTNAALIYAQQGLSDKQIEARTAITLKTANVTGQDTKDVSEELTAVWNGYKVNAEQAQLYVDRLAAVAATTASDLEELSTAMSKVASAANAMGVGEEQLAAQLSTIISATRQAPQSVGTALRTVYARISDIKAGIDQDGVTLGNYSGKMAALGISVLDVNGRLRDMGEVMEQIGGKWQNMTREQQVNLAQTMAGQRQYNNLLALFDNFDKYTQSLQVAANAQGTLNKQQDIYMDRTTARLNQLKAATEGIYMSLTDTDSVNSVIEALITLTNLTNNFIQAIGGGQGVLLNLGVIGVNVFQKQLVAGIDNYIHKLSEAKIQQIDLQEKINQARRKSNLTDLTQEERNAYAQRADFLEGFKGLNLSPESFELLQKLNDESLNTISKMGEVQQEINAIKKLVSDPEDPVLFVVAAEKIEESKNKIEEASQKVNSFKKSFSNLDLKTNVDVQTWSGNYAGALRKMSQNLGLETNQEIQQVLSRLTGYSNGSIKLPIELEIAKAKVNQELSQFEAILIKQKNTLEEQLNLLDQGSENWKKKKEEVQQYNKVLGATKEKTDELLKAEQYKTVVSNITKVISGISSIAMGIKNLTNAVSILNDKSLSASEKNFQLLSAIGMALPMIISSVYNLATMMAPFMSLGWAIALVGAITGIATALAIQNKIRIQNIKLQKQQAEESYKEARSKQEQIEKNRELYTSLRELNDQIKKSGLSRTEVKDRIEDLISKYDLQDSQINKLIHSYRDLGDIIEEIRQEQATKGLANAVQEISNATTSLQKEFELQNGYSAETGFYSASIQGNKISSNQQVQSALSRLGFNKISSGTQVGAGRTTDFARSTDFNYSRNFDLQTQEGLNEFLDFYDQLNEEIANLKNVSYQQKQALIDLRDTYKEQAEAYRLAKEDQQKYGTELAAFADQVQAGLKSGTIEGYRTARQSMIAGIQGKYNLSSERAQRLVDTQLRNNYNSSYLKYDNVTAFLDNTKIDKSKADLTKINALIDQILSQKNGQQKLQTLFKIGPQTYYNVSELEGSLERISNMDFSNVQNLLGLDMEDLNDAASQNYIDLSTIQEKVQGGKNISKTEWEALPEQLQQLFVRLPNKTYSIESNLTEFTERINKLKFDGFILAADALEQKINVIEKLTSNGTLSDNKIKLTVDGEESLYSSDDLQRDVVTLGDNGYEISTQNFKQAKADVEFLRTIKDTDTVIGQIVARWDASNDVQRHNIDLLKEINRLTEQNISLLNQDPQKLRESQEQFYEELNKAQNPLDSDVNQKQYQELAQSNYDKIISDFKKEGKEITDEVQKWARDSSSKAAEQLLRLDDAISDVTKNYDNWSQALKGGNQLEKAKAISELKDAYGDLFNIDGSALSDEFLTSSKNLQNFNKIATTTNLDQANAAWDELVAAMQQDLEIHVKPNVDSEAFYNDVNSLLDTVVNSDIPDIDVEAALHDEAFLNELSNLASATWDSADAAAAAFASMGYDADVIQVPPKAEPVTETRMEYTPPVMSWRSIPSDNGDVANQLYISQPGTWTPNTTTGSYVTPGAGTIRVKSIKPNGGRTSSGGNINFQKLRNSNGSIGSANSGSGKKGGGGGGGGGGKAYKPKDKKDLDKSKDHRYHDINQQLQKSNELLTSLGKKQSRLSGQAFIDNLNQQISLLEEQIELTEQKIKLQQQDLSERKEELTKLGVIFDGENIANYQAVINAKQTEYNALLAEQNALIEQANAAQSDSFDAEIQAKDKQAQNAKKQLDDYKKQMDQYETLQKQMRELQRKIEEDFRQQQIEKQIQKFRYSIEIHLDMRKAEREWNQFKRKHLDKTTVDLLFHSDFDDILDDFQINIDNFDSFITQNDQISDHLQKTYAEIEKIQEDGWSDVYGDNLARAYEDLQKDLQSLKEGIIGIDEIISQAVDNYLNAMDQVKEKSDQHVGQLEFIGELIEHDMELLEILYGEKNYKAMANYYDKLLNNQLKQVDYHKQMANYWKTEYENAVDEGNEKAAAAFLKNWQDEIKEFNASVTASAKTIKDQYNNAVDEVFDNLQKKLTKGKGFDYLDLEWDLLNKEDETFLDTVNSAFGLQDLEYTFNIAINDTADLKNQKALAKLRDQELKFLKDKDKLTQYDLDRAKKRLEIEQARIALEEAQQAKSTMRLRRDSQGNYRYEYVADQNQIAEAQQNYAKTQNDLYNLDKEYYNETTSNILSTTQEMNKALAEAAKIQDPQERKRQEELITQKYNERLKGLAQQLANTEKNLMSSAFQSIGTDLQTLSDTQADIMMNQMVPTWDNSVKQMTDVMLGEEGLMPLCQQAFVELDGITNQYALNLDALQKTAEIDLGSIKDGASDIADEFEEKVIPDNDTVIEQIISMGEEAKTSYQEIVAMAEAFNPSIAKAKELYDWLRDCVVEYKKMSADVDLDSDVTPRTRTNYVNDASGVKPTDDVAPVRDNGGSGGSGSGSSSYRGGRNPFGPPEETPQQPKKEKIQYLYYTDTPLYTSYDSQSQMFKGGKVSDGIRTDKDWDEINFSSRKIATNMEGDPIYGFIINGHDYYSNSGVLKRKTIKFDTGGYTGEWGDQSGKLAMLHEKELVLNKSDTSNILNSVSILRDILHNVGSNIFEKLSNLTSNKNISNLKTSEKQLEQNVHIEASFPNVNSKRQIEEAFNDLVNLAAQRAMRRK